jgi:hypothetical protein
LILNEIQEKLEQIDENVFYGAVNRSMKKETLWNYIVFNRTSLKKSKDKTGFTDGYAVHIVREDFIPEGLAEEVIEKMCEIAGIRESGEDSQYQYMVKPNTDTVLEMLSIGFVKARKK